MCVFGVGGVTVGGGVDVVPEANPSLPGVGSDAVQGELHDVRMVGKVLVQK